jgi:hypothetical protein
MMPGGKKFRSRKLAMSDPQDSPILLFAGWVRTLPSVQPELLPRFQSTRPVPRQP